MKITKRTQKENSNLPVSADHLGGIFSLRDAMDRLFDESFWSPFGLVSNDFERRINSFVPQVDISENKTEIKIRADIPGVDPDKVNIEVTEDAVSISGSVEKNEEEKEENFYRAERHFGEFSREFILPSKIDPESVEAKAKNGVIIINLKKQPSEQKRKVQVKLE